MSWLKCAACGSASVDGLLCTRCSERLRSDLLSIASMWEGLYGARGSGGRSGGGRSSDMTPLPMSARALKVASYVRNQLQSWVRELDLGDLVIDQRGCWCEPYRACRGWRRVSIPDDPKLWALWLSRRIQRVRGHAASDEICAEFEYCRTLLRRAIDAPPDLVTCGRCPICGGDVLARRGDIEGICRRCEQSGVVSALPVDSSRAGMWDQVPSMELTRNLIMQALPMYGVRLKPATFRQWVHRGKIRPAGERNGAPLYSMRAVISRARHIEHEVPVIDCWLCWAQVPTTTRRVRVAA